MMELILRSIRQRWTSLVGTFAAIALAVTLIAACGVLIESIFRDPLGTPTSRYDAASLVLQAAPEVSVPTARGPRRLSLDQPPRLPSAVADRARRVPGVAEAVADVSFYAQPLGADGTPVDSGPSALLGHLWSSAHLAPYRLLAGRAPARPDEVVLDDGLARRGGLHVGGPVRVLTAAGARPFVLTGVVAAPAPADRLAEPAVFFAPAAAAILAPGSQADAIVLFAEPGVDGQVLAGRVQAALGGGVMVLTPTEVRQPPSPGAIMASTIALAAMAALAGMVAFVVVFVVASTFAFSILQRHRELALLRAVGATPRQVRVLVAREALLLSLAAVFPGAAGGIAGAHTLALAMVRVGLLRPGLQVVLGPTPFVVAAIVAVLVTQVAVLGASRRSARIRPVEALREARLDTRPGRARLAAGAAVSVASLALLFAGVGVGAASPAGGVPGGSFVVFSALLLTVGAALLAPLLVQWGDRCMGIVLERLGGTAGFLARSNTRTNGRRVASVATPLVLTATLTCTMVFSQLTLDSASARLAARELPAHYLLLARGGGGLPPSAVAAAVRLPGVAAATGVRSTQIVVVPRDPNDPALLLDLPAVITYPALAIDQGGSGAAFDPHVVSGSLGDLRGDAIAVSAIEALTLGWQVGHRATILLPDGRLLRPRVAAIYQAPPSGATVNFLLPASAVAGERGQELVTQVYVKMRRGASPAGVTAALAGLAAQYPTLVVVGRDAYLARATARPPQEWLALALLVGLVVAYAAIAIVNTLVMATGERTRELALLRLLGATRAQVLRMIGWEATVVIALGLGTAAAITGATLVALSLALVGSVAVSIEPHLLLGVVAGGAGVVWAASLLPARLAMRTPPVVAIGVRE